MTVHSPRSLRHDPAACPRWPPEGEAKRLSRLLQRYPQHRSRPHRSGFVSVANFSTQLNRAGCYRLISPYLVPWLFFIELASALLAELSMVQGYLSVYRLWRRLCARG